MLRQRHPMRTMWKIIRMVTPRSVDNVTTPPNKASIPAESIYPRPLAKSIRPIVEHRRNGGLWLKRNCNAPTITTASPTRGNVTTSSVHQNDVRYPEKKNTASIIRKDIRQRTPIDIPIKILVNEKIPESSRPEVQR